MRRRARGFGYSGREEAREDIRETRSLQRGWGGEEKRASGGGGGSSFRGEKRVEEDEDEEEAGWGWKEPSLESVRDGRSPSKDLRES